MKVVDRYIIAARRAEQLVAQLGIHSLPVDPFEIAKQYDIEVRSKDSEIPGVSGCLLKVGDQFGIMYATYIRNEGFIRFSVAHELGHYFLPDHPEYLFPDGSGMHESRSGFLSNNSFELEADYFASGLLMPKNLFVKALHKAGKGFSAIQFLADMCKTSITATAIRFTACTEDPIAIVVSSGHTIDYCFMSEPIKNVRGFEWIKKGEPVPVGTTTSRFNRDESNVLLAGRTESWTTLDKWFSGAPRIEMKEEVVGLGNYGKTLTVLSTDELIDEEEEEELDELDGLLSWPSKKRWR
jgi:hypothetical protein